MIPVSIASEDVHLGLTRTQRILDVRYNRWSESNSWLHTLSFLSTVVLVWGQYVLNAGFSREFPASSKLENTWYPKQQAEPGTQHIHAGLMLGQCGRQLHYNKPAHYL